MSQKMLRHCSCKQCKSAKRRGKILGARFDPARGCMVSDYVWYHRFIKGRRPSKTLKEELNDASSDLHQDK